MLERATNLPASLMYPMSPTDQPPLRTRGVQGQIGGFNGAAHDTARGKLRTTLSRMKRGYDVKLYTRAYKVGDPIYLLNFAVTRGTSSKLHTPWKGPGEIVMVLTPYLYRVKFQGVITTVNHDRLKLCKDRNLPTWLIQYQKILVKDAQKPAEPLPSTVPSNTVCVANHTVGSS
jgi:hypothetical protein